MSLRNKSLALSLAGLATACVLAALDAMFQLAWTAGQTATVLS